ncbi:hypothetical protein ABIF97_006291 [Bradyrhizobium japonicum]
MRRGLFVWDEVFRQREGQTLTLRSALFARVSKGEATGRACILRDARSALLRMRNR